MAVQVQIGGILDDSEILSDEQRQNDALLDTNGMIKQQSKED